MTKQQLFNKVSFHLLKQMKKSECSFQQGNLIRKACQYHNKNGLKCAIGCLIPKSMYGYHLEDQSVSELLENNSELLAILLPSDIEDFHDSISFLSDLQDIHDSYEPAEWKNNLKDFSYHQDLKFTSL